MYRGTVVNSAIIAILILSSVFLQLGNSNLPGIMQQIDQNVQPVLGPRTDYHASYEPHDRISIYGNDDFVEQGWPGEGTPEDPYLIEGFEIVSDLDCIAIHGTTVHFIVRSCLVRSLAPSEHRVGIKVQSASQGIVENCIIEMKGEGLTMLLSSNIVLRNNTVRNSPDWGIWLSSCSSCVIRDNTVYNTPSPGITAFSLTGCFVANNTIRDCESDGISIDDSVSCSVLNNSIHDCDGAGISFSWCASSVFSGNRIYSNSGPGIYNYDSD